MEKLSLQELAYLCEDEEEWEVFAIKELCYRTGLCRAFESATADDLQGIITEAIFRAQSRIKKVQSYDT